jgi:hypothetical protein
MDESTALEIGYRRLKAWAELLARARATPFVLVGIMHGAESGTPVVCTCEDGLPDRITADFLRRVADLIDPA